MVKERIKKKIYPIKSPTTNHSPVWFVGLGDFNTQPNTQYKNMSAKSKINWLSTDEACNKCIHILSIFQNFFVEITQ